MKRGHWGISLLALIAMTAEASAAAVCDQGSSAALKTAAVQQELMVAGLTCHADAAYNRFVLADQPQLQKSDAELMDYFRNRDGSEAGYDSYKTKLANLAANKESIEGNGFCAETARVFRASEGVPLKDFIAGQHLLIAAPESCAVKFDMVEDAEVAGPSYALPAAPYGAPNLAATLPSAPPSPALPASSTAALPSSSTAARHNTDPDERQAYNAPQRLTPRQQRLQQEYIAEGWVYGPYGWVPPRPPRRWGEYGGYDD
jgi:hypothetical protein